MAIKKNVKKELISSKELASMLSVSVKFIEKHRTRIVGLIRIGRLWRFKVEEIRARLEAGENIFNDDDVKPIKTKKTKKKM